MKLSQEKNLSAFNFCEFSCPIVNAISLPLKENFNINYFVYIKIFEDGSMLRTSNRLDWSEKYFENEFYNVLDLYGMKEIPLETTGFRLLTGPPTSHSCKTLCQEYGIWNSLIMYEKLINVINLWIFATSCENTEIINFYMNNIHILKHFTFYFKEKAKILLDNNNPDILISTTLKPFDNDIKTHTETNAFIEETQIKKYIGENKFKCFPLTKQEFNCLKELSEGKSTKETGLSLNISPRTVETHINIIKRKNNFFTTSELISQFRREILGL